MSLTAELFTILTTDILPLFFSAVFFAIGLRLVRDLVLGFVAPFFRK